MDRKAKIVATIGPASQSEEVLRRLINAGVNIARLNFSHGTRADHARIVKLLRELSIELMRPITILQDLQGPKIRTGPLAEGSIMLSAGAPLTLTTNDVPGDLNVISIDFTGLPQTVSAGNRILLDDGNLELQVKEVFPDKVDTVVVLGGLLKPHKGVNLPGAKLDIPALTEKDLEDLKFGLQLGVDLIALSFVRTPDDIRQVRKFIEQFHGHPEYLPIIAKLERPEALDNLEAIIEEADGVMVARGDLGVEMSPETVPIAQKRIIDSANRCAKVVITATQMLESMINNPRPTRAEASDVANAIFDGSDAVMLSGETASGKYPIQAVEMMNAIICQAEANITYYGSCRTTPAPVSLADDTYFMTLAARELAHDKNVAAIAAFTKSGRTALMLSKAKPEVPILAFTPESSTYQRMGLYWGVQPHLVSHVTSIEEMIKVVEAAMISNSPIQPGQQIVLICGFPIHAIRPTNMALLHTVGEKLS